MLVHTRELTQQIQKEFERLGKFRSDITSNVVYGGININQQITMLKKTPPTVINF